MKTRKVYSATCGSKATNCHFLDKIKDFLSKFKVQEKDLATGFANIDIAGDGDAYPGTSPKYMDQLVCILHV